MKNPKALPYVYKLTHKQTGQFYFGFRSANKVPSLEDLGFYYFSSSATIKEIGFDNFEIEIIAEFFDGKDAFDFECFLISEHIQNPLNLNKALKGELCPVRKYTSIEHRQKLSLAAKGKRPSANCLLKSKEAIKNMSPEERKEKFGAGGKAAQRTIKNMSPEERKEKFGTMINRKHSEEVINRIREKNLGRKMSIEAKAKMSLAGKGRKQSKEHIEKRAGTFGGGGNPRAISITIEGVLYSCKKDAKIALGWSRHQLNKYIKEHQLL